jgi:hypothetical protein
MKIFHLKNDAWINAYAAIIHSGVMQCFNETKNNWLDAWYNERSNDGRNGKSFSNVSVANDCVLLDIQGVEWSCSTSDSDAYQKAEDAVASSLLLIQQFNWQKQSAGSDRRCSLGRVIPAGVRWSGWFLLVSCLCFCLKVHITSLCLM